jgi:hypothetical protein
MARNMVAMNNYYLNQYMPPHRNSKEWLGEKSKKKEVFQNCSKTVLDTLYDTVKARRNTYRSYQSLLQRSYKNCSRAVSHRNYFAWP